MDIRENTTFWAELKAHKICIPDYQRDYAQGRKDGGRVDNIREVFVEQLYDACTKGNSFVCNLGLVFGSYDEKDNKFIAVDGQQRLTTVFLLHWYMLWKSNKLKDYKEILSNFVWNTRSYSSQFANLLINLDTDADKAIIPTIKEHKDYFKVWEKDPSVKAMMNMLAEIEKQYNSSVDFELLFSDDCRIKYDILPLSANSDGKTYLKMNSRGRSLTTYENFKAKFQDVVSAFYPSKTEDPSFKSLSKSFDGNWLNFMLEQIKDSSSDSFSDPDIPFMFYINEYTIGRLCCKGKSDMIEPLVKAKIDKNGNLRDVPFVSFESYRPAFNNLEDVEAFRNSLDWIIKHFDTISEIDKKCRYGNDFFMSNILSNKPDYGDRAKFYALLKYASLCEYSEVDSHDVRLKRWARIFTNLIENTVIGKDNIERIMIAIDSVSTPDILSFLSSSDLPAFNREQVREEKEKTQRISEPEDKDWETILTEAEHSLFFRGAIRFLFRDAQDILDWSDFNKKLEAAQEYFSTDGVQDYNKDGQTKYYKKEAILLKAVLYHSDYWSLIEPQRFVLDNKADTWRNNILLNKEWAYAVHKILTRQLDVNVRDGDALLYKSLYASSLIEYVANQLPGSRIRWIHGHRAIYQPYYEGVLPDDDSNDMNFHRNSLLSKFYGGKTKSEEKQDNKIYCDSKIECCEAFFGWDIDFIYRGHFFKWNSDDYSIYLMEQKDVYYTPSISVPERELNEENFLTQLDSMLETEKQRQLAY